MKLPDWEEMTNDFDPFDGGIYLLAFLVKNNVTQKENWQFEKLEFIHYEDEESLYYLGGDIFTDWDIRDAEYYIICKD